MFTLQNFENLVDRTILTRGRHYFNQGAVLGLEEIDDGCWQAEVEGNDDYNVEIQLGSDNAITDYSCDCPYDGRCCKHVVATLLAIRQQQVVSIEISKIEETAPKKKMTFDELLTKVTHKEYREFTKKYASQNKDFKLAFELAFIEKDSNVDWEKKYKDSLARIIRKHSEDGCIGYRGTFSLANDVGELIGKIDELLGKGAHKDSFTVATVILKEMMATLTICDDSDGNIGGVISETVSLIERIADNSTASIREYIFDFLLTALSDKTYFDYGDYGYDLFSVFEKLAINLHKADEFLGYIQIQTAKLTGRYDSYRREFMIKRLIAFFKATGNLSMAEELFNQNLDIVELRQELVNSLIQRKEYSKAKKLISDGVGIANRKNHPGTVNTWEKVLLHIAVLENNMDQIRQLTKRFAFYNTGFDKTYYRQWRATYNTKEWAVIVDDLIAGILQNVHKESKRWQGSQLFNRDRSVLNKVAPIYIEEGYWDRLLELLRKENNLDVVLAYHSNLCERYPKDLVNIYLPAIELAGDAASSRSNYADLVRKMKNIIKDIPVHKQDILQVARRLVSKYPRRPAMIDELNRILK